MYKKQYQNRSFFSKDGNYFPTQEEKNLLNVVRKMHRLNNHLGNDNESYQDFLHDMISYYQEILTQNNFR